MSSGAVLGNREFERRVAEADSLVQALAGLEDEHARGSAVEAVQALLALHGDALARLLELLAAERDGELAREVARDPVVSGLLLLHGLHPLSFEERVRSALDTVRPYLGSHGGDVELLGVEDQVVRLRLRGSCDGCPSSAMTLKHAIEEAIVQAAPDLAAIEVADGAAARSPAGFVALGSIGRAGQPAAGPGPPAGEGPASPPAPPATAGTEWTHVADVGPAPPGTVRGLEAGGRALLLCRTGRAWYAYGDACPACRAPLAAASLDGGALRCPGCGARFDVERAGRSLDGFAAHLEPFPLLPEGDGVRVAVPATIPA